MLYINIFDLNILFKTLILLRVKKMNETQSKLYKIKSNKNNE